MPIVHEATSVTDSPAQTPAVAADDASRPGPVAQKLGEAAFRNREFMRSVPGELMFRNALNSMVAWVPTITSFVATRALWEKYESFAEKNAESLITKAGKPLLSKESPLGRMTTFIAGGWFTYRATAKLYNRTYDRLFAAKTPEAAAESIQNLPKTLKHDIKEIAPGGLAEIIPAAPALAIIPSAFLNQKTWRIKKGDFKQAKAGWLNNTLSTGVAYSAFLEICDHIYPAVTGGKDYGDYNRNLKGLPPKETVPNDEKKFGFFTNDGAGRTLLRTVPSVMIGFAAYFAGQRWSYAKFGMPTEFGKTGKEVAKNWAKDYAAWAPTFTAYTVISQVYRDNYDKLFDKLEHKHAVHQADKPGSYVERVQTSREKTMEKSAV